MTKLLILLALTSCQTRSEALNKLGAIGPIVCLDEDLSRSGAGYAASIVTCRDGRGIIYLCDLDKAVGCQSLFHYQDIWEIHPKTQLEKSETK